MNPPTPLIDTTGHSFQLDRELASGGEGAVFTLRNDSSQVAKVYHRPPTVQTVEKLTAMIALANPHLLTLAAWPGGLLHHSKTRQVMGFVMPRLIDCQPIQHLYNPVQRMKSFPRAGWTFQVRAAQNLAAAFDEVHKAGCLVGDVNQSNALVSPQALVRLIDCDSFQVRANGKQYLCEVGVPHYTPPELQGKPLRGVVRTENHDRFGLAVLVYQLLFVGRHPYAGVYQGAGDPSFEQLITEFRFAQGPLAHSWGMVPPPHTPTFADIPPNVGELFRRAFERGSEKDTRPRPREWLSTLKQLEQNSIQCIDDPGHMYWREVRRCVWCRLAANGGPEYYFGVAGDVGTFAIDESKLQEVLNRLSACRRADFGYERNRFKSASIPEPEPLPDGLEEHRTTELILALTAGLCLLAMPLGLVRGFICAIGFLGTLVFGGWLAVHHFLSPWWREYRRRIRARNGALNDLDKIEEDWERHVRSYERNHAESNAEVRDLISDCRELASEYLAELRHLTAKAEAMARRRHLRLHLIADADIPKIGTTRKIILSTYNILTADDIDENRIREIKGFGDALTSSLLAWREYVLRGFRFDPSTGISPADQRALTQRFRTSQQKIFVELDRELSKLESLAPTCAAGIKQLIPKLKEAIAVYRQANADLRLMKGSN